MSVSDNNHNQTPGGTPDGVPDNLLADLNMVIENLNFIEETLRQLQKKAKASNESSLNYYLGMATLVAEQRLKAAEMQKTWLACE